MKPTINQDSNIVMEIKNYVLNQICAIQQSNRLMPVLIALALVGAVLGVTGCNPPHH